MQPVIDRLAATLSAKRFLHTLGVMHTAVVLADASGVDPREAALAALLHDGSKPIPPAEIEADLARRGMSVPAEDRATPATWHGLHAAVRLREELAWPEGAAGTETAGRIARAVELHSSADADMEPLSRVLFTADALEPGRDFPGAEELRRIARNDPDSGFRATLRHKCAYILGRGMTLHPRARRALDHYGGGE